MNMKTEQLNWYRVADSDELPAGRVKTVTVGTHSMALTHIDGKFTAMDNRCPHQGGPLGEGSIEVGTDGQCWLRFPWHGWDFDPETGLSPGGHEGAAAFACSGYAKLTGKPASCLTIAGPGATNLMTGLWDAKVDRAPVLVLTGQVDAQVLGPGAFQEIDL